MKIGVHVAAAAAGVVALAGVCPLALGQAVPSVAQRATLPQENDDASVIAAQVPRRPIDVWLGKPPVFDAVQLPGVVVVDAELISARSTLPPGRSIVVTEYTFRLVEHFRGNPAPRAGETFTVREVGGVGPDGKLMHACESHRLEISGRYLLVIRPDAGEVVLPFVRVLQILDGGQTLADESGRVARLSVQGGLAFVDAPGTRDLFYDRARANHTHQPVAAPGTMIQPPEPPAEGGEPISARAVLALLRAPGVAEPTDPPAGLPASPGPFDTRFVNCGYRTGPSNYAGWFTDQTTWEWFLAAGDDWNSLTDFSANNRWLVGNTNTVNVAPFANNGVFNAGSPEDAIMTAGGYGSWASLGSANGVCFLWRSGPGACDPIVESDIFVNPVNTGNEAQFRKSMVHEMGHALGLQHEDRYAAIMVAGTWRVPPNYASWLYNRVDDLQGGRAMIQTANSVGAGFVLADWFDMATQSQSHPSPGVSADVRNNLATLTANSANFYQTLTLSRMYVENRGRLTAPGTTTLSVYLSINPIITDNDIKVYEGSWTDFPAGGVANNFSVPFALNDRIPPGDYFVGWVLSNNGVDLDAANNVGILRDAYETGFALKKLRVLAVAPPNDSCATPRVVTGGTILGNTAYATSDGAATCGNSGNSKDVWFRYTAPSAGELKIDTCGTSFDTVLSTHSSCVGGTASTILCNDDAPAGSGCAVGTNKSYLAFPVSAGQEVRIRLAGFQSESGPFVLNINFNPTVGVPNDECALAAEIGAGATAFTTIGATASNVAATPCGQVAADVWYRYTHQTASGPVQISTCGSTPDTVLAVYKDTCSGVAGGDAPQRCNDNGCGVASSLFFQAFLGESYLIRLGGKTAGATGSGTLLITPVTCQADFNNDGFVDDTDFVFFTQEYEAFTCTNQAGCRGDLSGDGFIDDTDFVFFTQAYEAFVCP